eukprot:6254762-Prymnesium_polylepis.1
MLLRVALLLVTMLVACAHTATVVTGGDRTPEGCIPSAGYSFCDTLGECVRPWETPCPAAASPPANPADALLRSNTRQ